MEKTTIALIIAVIAILVGLGLLFGGVGWYVSNSKNVNNPSQTGPWVLMGIGVFLIIVGIIALAIYLFYWPAAMPSMSSVKVEKVVEMPDTRMTDNKMMMDSKMDRPSSMRKSTRIVLPDTTSNMNNSVMMNNKSTTSPVLGEALEKSYVRSNKPSLVYTGEE